MAIEQMSPTEANEALESDASSIYLDVRTQTEFESGHAPGAYNVPVVFLAPGRPAEPNPEFVKVVEGFVTKDTRLIVGCLSGGRSQRACEILEKAGFTDVVNVRGGFGGQRDRAGNIVAPGWSDSQLPIETGQPDGRSYEDLTKGG